MAHVDIAPLPGWARKLRLYRPGPSPVFPGNDRPSLEAIELALALFHELDPESQDWYGGATFVTRLEAMRDGY